MTITIEGTAREIADLVREIQDRQISGKDIADAMERRIKQKIKALWPPESEPSSGQTPQST